MTKPLFPNLPVVFLSEFRVPDYAYPNWELKLGEGRELSDLLYETEWKGGSERQMQYVVEATQRAGLQNFPQMLRDANADLVARVMELNPGKKLNYLEIGAGVSTVNAYKWIIDIGIDAERLYGTLVEPSEKRTAAMKGQLESFGLKEGKNFRILNIRDLDVPNHVEPNSQDIISAVATLHHHAYLDAPINCLYFVQKQGGVISIADWHCSLWDHPNRVYKMLVEMGAQEEDLSAFAKKFPKSLIEAPQESEGEKIANNTMKVFWNNGWKNVKYEKIAEGIFLPSDEIFIPEAHRPVRKLVYEMEKAGYVINDPYLYEINGGFNPHRPMFKNPILCQTAGLK